MITNKFNSVCNRRTVDTCKAVDYYLADAPGKALLGIYDIYYKTLNFFMN